ncbi:uncharacterized protein LOC132707961 isoform X2 [Cylas formicarius]|uniref:uncharacterized protein LOC132707961 isoform X2 n=1 Tax=Cylas formicarius TaxID=197179 RepID=UPI002958C8DC|nr:uncharacterized protein LOC132707961 isoform X2 [Cylas formicarius]
MSSSSEIFVLSVFFFIIMVILYGCCQSRIKFQEGILCAQYTFSGLPVHGNYTYPQQHGQHIFNISGRVPEQHHCTPDAYLTVEHINVTNQMNKPSCYNDEPPSYEDAIKMVQGGTAHAPATQQPHSAAAIPAVHRLSV